MAKIAEVDTWSIQLHRKTNDLVLVMFMKDGYVKKIPVQTLIESYFMLMELENETFTEEPKKD